MMRSRVNAVFSACFALASVALAPSPAVAEQARAAPVTSASGAAAKRASPPKSAAAILREKEQAKALWGRGNQLYDEAKYEEALRFYLEAEQLHKIPKHTFCVAQAFNKLGKLVEAKERFSIVMSSEPNGALGSDDFRAQAEAPVERAKLVPNIPRLQIIVTHVPAHTVVVMVDGVDVPHYDKPIEVNPGEHVITAHAAGGELVTQAVTVEKGATKRVELSLAPSFLNPRRKTFLMATAFGLGAVGVTAGAIAAATREDKDRGMEVFSYISLGVGAAGLATGLTLFLVHSEGSSGSATSEVAVRGTISPTFVGVTGSF